MKKFALQYRGMPSIWIREAAGFLDVSDDTVRRWANWTRVPTIQGEGISLAPSQLCYLWSFLRGRVSVKPVSAVFERFWATPNKG